jgi:CheY-like chemotaxis protein
MPRLDGYEATRRLRRLEAECGRSPTPIVALTANALDESCRSCRAAGFDAFLVKPVEFRTLAGAVEKVCTATEATSLERLRAS